MGPDEYHDGYPGKDTPGFDNNSYTNLMAVWVLCRALDLFNVIPEEHCTRICTKLDVKDAEISHWQDISRKMRLVFHEDGILNQFEGYSELEEFDWDTYREKHGQVMRLDRILEAESDTPNRYKASKQADVLMLFYLFLAKELEQLFDRLGYPFDPEMIPRNINYYLARTSNGSTLSDVVNSWVLARSDRARSWGLFSAALKSDVADVQGGTTPEGIHPGAMAGTVDLIQRCYTGIEPRAEVLRINSQLPDELARLRLQIRYREASLDVDVTHHTLKIHVVALPWPADPARFPRPGDGTETGRRNGDELGQAATLRASASIMNGNGKSRTGADSRGTILSVRGSVIDAQFPGTLLPLNQRLTTSSECGSVTAEVVGLLDARTIRGIALDPTRGLARGAEITDTGGTIEVPLGEELVGRMFYVFGETIDGKEELPEIERWSIHQPPERLAKRATISDVFITGIKAIDLLSPLEEGWKAGLFGGAGIGKKVLGGADENVC